MPEDNQIQTGFQPEIQTNRQIQQNNSVQDQQINQGIVQQNNVGPAEQNLSQSPKPCSSRLTKIVSCIFGLLGIALIGLGIYWIFETQSDWHYSDYTIRDIIMDSGIFILGPLGILFIVIGILSYRTPNVDIYYHPTRLTKILSGIYRFLGIALVRAGLWNFSLIGTENLSFLKILYVGGVITLCGILYIFLGRLLYNTKSKAHIGFSLLLSLVANIMSYRILKEFSDIGDKLDGNLFFIIITLFSLFYFSVLTIRWIIKCLKFNKKGIINPKYLNQTPSKKKVGIITTIVLFLLIIVNLIYGKIQWSKIPEVDESIFAREGHQTKLPDEEDALIQLKNLYGSGYTNDVWNILDVLYFYENNLNFQIQNSGKRYENRCIIVYSGDIASCGTMVWDNKTLSKFFNSYYTDYPYYSNSSKKASDYFTINGKKLTILEYMDIKEPEIRSDLQGLDKILSLNYYLDFSLPTDSPNFLLPQFLQGYSRASMVALQYYTLKNDWEMVEFIIKLNYKMVDIFNSYGSTFSHFISFIIQNVTDESVNSLVKLFPNDFRIQLSERYSNLNYNKDWMTKERAKGEFNIVWKNWAKDVIFTTDIGSNKPSLLQFLFHFPFLSKKDTNRFMEYAYYNLMRDERFDFDSVQLILPKSSLYNYYGNYPYQALRPRVSTYNNRLKYSLFHKQALIDNLRTGKYQTWFNELEWSENPNLYNDNHIPTDEELNE